MRRLAWALAWALVVPAATLAQTPGPTLSLDIGTSPLPRLGLWTGVSERLSLGFELDVDTRGWTVFPDGNPAMGMSGRDWAVAAGPSALLRLARSGPVSLSAYGSLTYGNHWLAPGGTDPLDRTDERGFGVRAGLGLDWAVSDRWSLGAVYSGRWLSEDDRILGIERGHWNQPRLGFSFKLRF